MANPKIEVEVSSNVEQLRKGFSDSEASLVAFGNRLAEIKKKFNESNGVITNLQNKLAQLNKNLESATDIQSIAKYNIRIRETENELKRLESAGLRAGNSLGQLPGATIRQAQAVNQLRASTSGYNSIGIEFSRIIQDAPFGIIGIGNNITQLAGNFQQLRNQSTSTGAALKTAFASIISPTNLLVLGISAVTTAFTLYAMSARSAKTPINELKDAQDEFNESLKETDRLLGKEVFAQFLKEVGLIEQQNIGGKLIDVPTFNSAAEVVDKLSDKIANLRKGELDLLAKFFQTQIAESLRSAANNAGTFAEELAKNDVALYSGLLGKVNVQLDFYKSNTEKSKTATKELTKEVKALRDSFEPISIGPLRTGNVDALRAVFEARKKGGQVELTPQELLDQAVSNAPGISDSLPIIETADVFEEQTSRMKSLAEELSGAFGGVGSAIASAFGKPPAFGQFIGTFLAFAAKLVAANFTIATSNAIAGASSAAVATGPAAPITLPAFIAGAIGVVGAAFAAIKGGGSKGGGGSVGSSVSGQTFSGSGISDFNPNRELFGELVVRGNDLVYVLGETRTKIAKG